MYDYSIQLTYRDSPHDDQYREELLEVFGIHSGPCPYDELTPKIEELYTTVAKEFDEVACYIQKHLYPFLQQHDEPLVDKKNCFMSKIAVEMNKNIGFNSQLYKVILTFRGGRR